MRQAGAEDPEAAGAGKVKALFVSKPEGAVWLEEMIQLAGEAETWR